MNTYQTLGTRGEAAAHAFYDAVLGTIGWAMHAAFPGWRGYSPDGKGEGHSLWICAPFNSEPASVGNGTMAGFMVKDRATVDAFHAAALAHGGQDEGAPGPRPHYGPHWYAAYVRDPDGNKLAAVFNG